MRSRNESQRQKIEAEATHKRDMKARAVYQEYMAKANALYEDSDYEGVIKTLEMLERINGLYTPGSDLKDQAIQNLINHERYRAAKVFLEAKKNQRSAEKKRTA